jgi:hypothetical protein
VLPEFSRDLTLLVFVPGIQELYRVRNRLLDEGLFK